MRAVCARGARHRYRYDCRAARGCSRRSRRATCRPRLYGGTGLTTSGHRLAHLQRGAISVESERGAGSTFRVELPAAPTRRRRVDEPSGSATEPEVRTVPTWLDRVARACLPPDRRDDPIAVSNARLMLAYAFLPMATGAIWAVYAGVTLPDAERELDRAVHQRQPAFSRSSSPRCAGRVKARFAPCSPAAARTASRRTWDGAGSPARTGSAVFR
jgi:hypothetical protein